VYGNTERRVTTPRVRYQGCDKDKSGLPEHPGRRISPPRAGRRGSRFSRNRGTLPVQSVRQRNDVEDIAQQVFAKVYLSIRNFDFRSSLITWIYKITVNECFDYLRKKKVRKLVYESDLSEDEVRRVENADPAVDRQPAADQTLARRDYVLKLLSRVSEEERMLLMMKEVEGYSVEELASQTGMNENTIKVKLFRARQKLVKAAQRLDKAPGLVAG